MLKSLSLPEGCESILAAVSGGADSVCMLHMLSIAARERGFRLCAAHYEHGIRGAESLRDAEFVRALCQELGIRLVLEHGDVPAYAAAAHLGVEEAARERRYAFLQRAARELACEYIATAHNADDNAETLIFNLARGAGAKGLCGIPARRGNIIRPMLGLTRGEIEEYLARRGLSHVEDSSNAADEFSRNLIRHRVIPVLREINPALPAAAARTARLIARDEDFIAGEAARFIAENYDGEGVDAAALCALHPAVSSRVVRALYPHSLSEAHVEAVLSISALPGLARAALPGGIVVKEQGRVYFSRPQAVEITPRSLTPGEEVLVPEAGLRLRVYSEICPKEIHGLFKTYRLKCESIYGNLRVTGRMAGDRIAPIGRGCTKSLKSIFTERHMTQRERAMTAVIRDDAGVAAVIGVGVDARCAPMPGERVICIEAEKI